MRAVIAEARHSHTGRRPLERREPDVHFHTLDTDGTFYARSDGELTFLRALPPTPAELKTLVAVIEQGVIELLEKLGLGPDDDGEGDPDQLALGLRDLYTECDFNNGARRHRGAKPREPATFPGLKAHEDGFDLDANARLRPEAVSYQRLGVIIRPCTRPSQPGKPRNMA